MVNISLFLIFLSFYNSGFYKDDYSILSGNIEEKEVEILKKDIPKKKKPYITLLTNVALPVVITPSLGALAVPLYFHGYWEDYWWGIAYIAPPVFSFTTIPAHIYVRSSFVKIVGLIYCKVFLGIGTIFLGWATGYAACIDGEEGECESGEKTAIALISIGASILGGIYIYEVIDTYRAAVKYNEKLEKERENSQSSFFIQPIITPKGDIFLTGGIRF